MNTPCFQIHLVSSLEKVFPDESPLFWTPTEPVTVLTGEWFSFQTAIRWDGQQSKEITVELDSPLDGLSWRVVELVPCELAVYPGHDDNYLRTTPGLYPDRLHRPKDGRFRLRSEQWRSIWIDVPKSGMPGDFPITVRIREMEESILGECTLNLRRIPAKLPEQRLCCTQWLHTDCLSDYYHVPAFSEEHWRITENFVREAVRLGINMLYTPLVTPPLDTQIGGERTTVQLLDIWVKNGTYRFGFERLHRWVKMGQRCGVRYFEMNHLFTQWGAEHCPKILAHADGEMKQIFGWKDDAAGPEYRAFLGALLPELTAHLREWGIADRTVFHLSDEPNAQHLEQYRTVRSIVEPLLAGFPIMDALSNYSFYEQGLVEKPICATTHIQPFLDAQVPELWAYYCCGQYVDVSNRFFAMPSARNRIIGIQLYKYRIAGFLQWGYNFYNTQLSREKLDPYRVTDAGGAFPSGDAFSVYPGEDGTPEESLRAVVFSQAIQDIQAFELLESLTSREYVMQLVEGGLDAPLTFTVYPHEAAYLLELRQRINEEIDRRTETRS